LNPTDTSRFAAAEKIVVDYYVISSKSFNDYIHEIKPTKRRLIIAWSIVALLFAFTFELSVLAYRNDPGLAATVGFPFALSKKLIFLC